MVGVDAWVGLEELHSEQIGCCGVVSAVSFEEGPLEELDFWTQIVPSRCSCGRVEAGIAKGISVSLVFRVEQCCVKVG